MDNIQVKTINKCLESNDKILDEIILQISLLLKEDKEVVKDIMFDAPTDMAIRKGLGIYQGNHAEEINILINEFGRFCRLSGRYNNREVI